MRGKRGVGVVEVGGERGDGEMALVEPVAGGDVAAAGGGEQEERHARAGAEMAAVVEGVAVEALVEVGLG